MGQLKIRAMHPLQLFRLLTGCILLLHVIKPLKVGGI